MAGILLFLLAGPAQGQTSASLLARRANLSIVDAELVEAIRALQRASGVPMAFSLDLIPANRRVSCACDSVTVGEALDSLLLGTGLQVREGRRQVLIGRGEGTGSRPAEASPPIRGRVVEGGTGFPLPGVEVRLLPSEPPGPPALWNGGSRRISGALLEPAEKRALTGEEGRFSLPSVPPGEYTVQAQAPGFLPGEFRVRVDSAEGSDIHLELRRTPIPLEAIVISPGAFGLLEGAATLMGTRITREEIEAIPQFGDDAFRVLQRMPGVASGDLSTQLNVRGSGSRDVLVRLDGLELYEPFHLKDVDGVFGIVDLQSLGEISLLTGGFGVEHGNRVGGVLDMRTRSPPVSGTRTTLGLSLSSVSAISQGTFAEGRGSWLASLRRGFLDIVLAITDNDGEVSPGYWDILGKTDYRLSRRHRVGLNVLVAGDDMRWDDNETGGFLNSDWANRYLWGTWDGELGPGLRVNTVLAWGGLSRDRGGRVWLPGGGDFTPMSAQVQDDGSFSFLRLRQGWELDLGSDLLFKAGFDVKEARGRYDYLGKSVFLGVDPGGGLVQLPDSNWVDLGVRGTDAGVWAALRGRSAGTLTWEAGLRLDSQSHTGDSDLAPRLLLRWDPVSSLTFKASWGRYFQAQAVQELSASDGEMSFSPSQMAEQVAAGVEARLPGRVTGRVEGYRRVVLSPPPEFLNLTREINPFLELQTDRIRIDPTRGRAHGLEITLARDGSPGFSWATSYALAVAEQKVSGRWVPRTLDQRHTFNLHAAFPLGRNWQVSGSYQYHTGWPFTEQYLEPVPPPVGGNGTSLPPARYFGPLNGDRLPDYKRLDLRVTRAVELPSGRLELYLDIFNATNEENLRGYEYYLEFVWPQGFTTGRGPGEELLPILPTLGFRWEF